MPHSDGSSRKLELLPSGNHGGVPQGPAAGTRRGKLDISRDAAASVADLGLANSLSNRRGIGSENEPSGFGVDRLSMSFPLAVAPDVERFQLAQTRRAHAEDGGSTSMSTMVPLHTRDVPGGRTKVTAGVFVGAAQVAGAWWGKVEANPSRFADPDGCSLLDPADLAGAVDIMAGCAESVGLKPTREPEDWSVKRLDLARDVRGVPDPSGLLWGLLPLKRPHARHQTIWADPSHRGAQTLWVGSGAGGARLYDQHEAYADKGAEPGQVRWELEAREDWIGREVRSGGATMGAVLARPERLASLVASRWEWSKMGTTVTASADVLVKVAALVEVGGFVHDGEWLAFSQARARSLLGSLLLEAHGMHRGSMSKEAGAFYGKVREHLGVVMSPRLFAEQEDAPVGRLDFESGTWRAA